MRTICKDEHDIPSKLSGKKVPEDVWSLVWVEGVGVFTVKQLVRLHWRHVEVQRGLERNRDSQPTGNLLVSPRFPKVTSVMKYILDLCSEWEPL